MAQSFHERFHGLLETWPENALDCMLLVLMQLRPNEWSPTRAVLNASCALGWRQDEVWAMLEIWAALAVVEFDAQRQRIRLRPECSLLRAPDLVTTPPRHVVAIPAPCHDMQIPVASLGDAEVLDSPELERLQRPCVDLTAEVDANNCLPGSVVCGHYLWGRCPRHFDQPLRPHLIRDGVLAGSLLLRCSLWWAAAEADKCRVSCAFPLGRAHQLPSEQALEYAGARMCLARSNRKHQRH